LRRLEGRGDISLTLKGSGHSIYELSQSLNGTARLVGRQGAILGVNVEQLLRRLERRPLSGAGDFRGGRTPYDRLTVNLKIVEGNAAAEEVRIEGPAVHLTLVGSASIPARDLDLKGTASLVPNAGSAGDLKQVAFELPFLVQGPWEDPIMLPDPYSLIRRSGAGAPLLNAVRDHRAREAVREAIERLTGTAPVPAPQPAPFPAVVQPDTPEDPQVQRR
jgi:AsmA protein